MLPASAAAILARLSDDDLVLDVGGWAKPFARATHVIDLLPYETRGLYGYDQGSRGEERFSTRTWEQRDICAREPWPYEDARFAFAVCSHTLEDVRDPVWVCQELQRVARAGYVEVPSRLEEQSWGVHGEWAGWSHHHWLCDVEGGGISFTFKPHVLHARPELQFPPQFHAALSPEERVQPLWWEGSFAAAEQVHVGSESLDPYLAAPVQARHPGGRAVKRAGVFRRG